MDDVPARLDFERAERRSFTVGAEAAGERLDLFLLPLLEGFSRAGVQRLIRDGHVALNGVAARPAAKVRERDRVEVTVPLVLPPAVDPEDLPLRVLVEEASFAVLDKAAGMAVHPGKARVRGTIANAIAHRWGVLGTGGAAYRPGIVHRLDLDTSGVMVVAKTEAAHGALSAAFKERRVLKEYRALVLGDPAYDEDLVDAPLGRDLADPKRMAVRYDGGREASTEVVVVERFGVAADVLCRPRTGRTHQIRVHLAHRGHPLLGDATYARGRAPPVAVPRLMLHAIRLVFPHPATGEPVDVAAPLPPDFAGVRDALRAIDGGARGG